MPDVHPHPRPCPGPPSGPCSREWGSRRKGCLRLHVTLAGAWLRFRGLGCVGHQPRARGGWGRVGGRDPSLSLLCHWISVLPGPPPAHLECCSPSPLPSELWRPGGPPSLCHTLPQPGSRLGGQRGEGTHLPSSSVWQQLQVQVQPYLRAQTRGLPPPPTLMVPDEMGQGQDGRALGPLASLGSLPLSLWPALSLALLRYMWELFGPPCGWQWLCWTSP